MPQILYLTWALFNALQNQYPPFQEAGSLVILMNSLLESLCRIFEQILFSTLVESGRGIYYRTSHDEHNIEAPTGSSENILRLLHMASTNTHMHIHMCTH